MPNSKSIEVDGFAIVDDVLDRDQLDALEHALSPIIDGVPAAGVRGLAQRVPYVHTLAPSAIVRALVEPELGSGARLVRSILFNECPQANWQVPWHQDLAIAVHEHASVEGYTTWSMKGDVHHVQPPIDVLERMLTVRCIWIPPTTPTVPYGWRPARTGSAGLRLPMRARSRNSSGRRSLAGLVGHFRHSRHSGIAAFPCQGTLLNAVSSSQV